MNRSFFASARALTAASLLCACSSVLGLDDFTKAVDDDPSGGGMGGGGASGASIGGNGGTGGAANAASASGSGGSGGAAEVCEGATTIACGGECVDIANDGANCGSCDHDCGGGACDKGACQPMVVVDDLTKPVFDVGATQLYYGDSTGHTIMACPKGGCALQPTQLAAVGAIYSPDDLGVVLVSGDTFAFLADPAAQAARPSLYVCGIAGCPASPKSVVYGYSYFATDYALSNGDAYWGINKSVRHSSCSGNTCSDSEAIIDFGDVVDDLALSADGTSVYFVSPPGSTTTTGHALMSCPASGPCAAPTVLYATAAGVTQTVVQGSKIYMLTPGDQGGYPRGKIQACPTTGTCTPETIVGQLPHPTIMAVDDHAVYWFNFDAPAQGLPKQIATCPLSGCTSGPKTLAANQDGTTALHTDDKFVYWATGTQILRIAK